MKLLFVIKSLRLQGGGAERVLADVSRGLVGRGHEVVILTFDPVGSTPFYAFDPTIRLLPMEIGDSRARSGPRQTLRRIRSLRRVVKREAPDVAIGFMDSAYIPLALGLAGTGIPVIGSEHIVYSHYADRPIERMLLRLVPPFLHSATAISEEMRKGFPVPMQRKMTIIPNPVTATGQRADAVGPERKTLLSVGRLEDQKDHKTLVSAFSQLAEDFPQWKLRIVGDGVLRADLEDQVRRNGLEDRVELPGATADIGVEYSGAQLFAISSTYESFGLVTAEAFAHGLPAVGFADCPGTNELIIDGENGLLVEGSDRPTALALGLKHLMSRDDERARMATRGPERIKAFALDRVIDLWESLAASASRVSEPVA